MEYPVSVCIMNNRAKKVVVTGGSGKAGRACVADLIAHGHQVFNVDNVIPTESVCPFIVADLADFGQTLDALSSVDTGIYGKAALNAFDAIVPSGRHSGATTVHRSGNLQQ